MRVAAGIALVAAHAIGFTAIAHRSRGDELVVEVTASGAAPATALELDATLPPALADRIATRDETAGPGLQRRTWSIDYRGGFSRGVYAAQLVGPYQDPATRACTGRAVVTQKLLDDGHAGPGTIAHELEKALTAELRGTGVWGAGDFRRVEKVSVRWAQLHRHPQDQFAVLSAPYGYVRVGARIVLDRVTVPLVIALVPSGSAAPASVPEQLGFRVVVRADLDFDNRVVNWLSRKLDGAGFATRLAREQIDGVVLTALAPPPPFAIPGGPTLAFTFCAEPPTIIDGEYGALPFAVEIGALATDPRVLPPRRGPAPHAPPDPTSELALDLDLDALDALLFELWRAGYLDAQLATAGLDAKFNEDPTVATLLSLRISPVKLALPPTLSVAGTDTLRLAADARVAIEDGADGADAVPSTTTGRVWGALDLRIAPPLVPTTVNLSALDLACERGPAAGERIALVPCYGDLVATMRDRAPEFQDSLTRVFTGLLADIFVERRLGATGLPADLVIRRAVPRVTTRGENGSLHLDLSAALVPAAQ